MRIRPDERLLAGLTVVCASRIVTLALLALALYSDHLPVHVLAQTGAGVSSLTFSPTGVVGGNTVPATVTLSSAAPSGGAVVTLASNNAAATVPGSITVPAGGTSATFSATTQPVAAPVVTTVSASYGGISKSATLDVTPAITPGNIAGTASVTVSSQNTSAR